MAVSSPFASQKAGSSKVEQTSKNRELFKQHQVKSEICSLLDAVGKFNTMIYSMCKYNFSDLHKKSGIKLCLALFVLK